MTNYFIKPRRYARSRGLSAVVAGLSRAPAPGGRGAGGPEAFRRKSLPTYSSRGYYGQSPPTTCERIGEFFVNSANGCDSLPITSGTMVQFGAVRSWPTCAHKRKEKRCQDLASYTYTQTFINGRALQPLATRHPRGEADAADIEDRLHAVFLTTDLADDACSRDGRTRRIAQFTTRVSANRKVRRGRHAAPSPTTLRGYSASGFRHAMVADADFTYSRRARGFPCLVYGWILVLWVASCLEVTLRLRFAWRICFPWPDRSIAGPRGPLRSIRPGFP